MGDIEPDGETSAGAFGDIEPVVAPGAPMATPGAVVAPPGAPPTGAPWANAPEVNDTVASAAAMVG